MQYPRLVESKTAANEVRTIAWNPGMDLLATVFSNETLTCSRLLSLQKVWSKQSIGKIISIAWRPDGRVLAIGAYNDKTKENICALHDVEDGKDLHTIKLESEITSLAWFCSPESNTQIGKEDPIRPKKVVASSDGTKPENENFSHQLAHKQTRLNILLISTSDGYINFYSLGLFYIGKISVFSEPNSKIFQTHMSKCMRFITSVIMTPQSAASKPVNNHMALTTMKLMKLDLFHERSSEMLRVAKMYAKITDELEYLDDTLNAIKTSWTDVLAGLDHKLSAYNSRREAQPDGPGSFTFISADDFLQLLVLGTPSDNLEKFLADMSDKGLRKLCVAIEQTCQRVQNLIVKNAQKCCYHLHNDLNMLRGMSLWRSRFSDVGLDDKSIVEAMKDVGSLVLKLTEMQQVIDHSLKSTKSFFRWLISIACRMSGEQNSVSSDISKTTQQDLQLITDFILDNFDRSANDEYAASILFDSSNQNQSTEGRPTCSNFTLEDVGQYFRNENLNRFKYAFLKPGSNFWITFFKQRPHMAEPKVLEEDGSSVLLFYPHNSERSLIQEHTNACQSIEKAFKSVSENIKLNSDNGDGLVINLKDFIRNAPHDKIRVETDGKSMQNFTLFQLKPSPISKQYLMIQSISDKTFRLISVEFQSLPLNTSRPSTSRASASHCHLQIMDSCFYELRATKKMLLTFLLVDQAAGDTIMVQLNVDKLIEESQKTRTMKDMNKIFKSNDTIDKHSSPISLNIDIHTMPANERKNDDVMVKKIKGLTGQNMFASSSRGVIAFTSNDNKHLHLYELDPSAGGAELVDDEFVSNKDTVDESLIDTEMVG